MTQKYEGISVFTNTPVEIVVEKGVIIEVREIYSADAGQSLPYISPGFLDMQVNGYRGSDYSLETFSKEDFVRIIDSLAKSGTTQHVATIVTRPQATIVKTLKTITGLIEKYPEFKGALAGVHIEGPYISSEDGPRGAHDKRYVRDPDIEEFDEWMDTSRGLVSIVTLAPERKGAITFIREISKRGVAVAIGHTAASPEKIREAVDAGAKLSTHLGNGSHAMIPRLKNYIWEQLAEDRLTAGIITDGFHLPPSVIKVFVRVKGLNKLILVSDAALLGGLEPGIYKWGALEVEVFPDGHLGQPGTEYLAGAGHLLNWDIAHFIRFTGYKLGDAIKLCTINPARFLHLKFLFGPSVGSLYGRLEKGAPANLVLFEYKYDSDVLEVLKTVRDGKVIFSG